MQLHEFDLNLLVVFNAIYTEKHLTKAGKQIHLTQSAMSHALSRLRTLLSDPLFVRHGNQMRATPRAEELAIHIQEILQLTQNTLSDRGQFDPAASSRVFKISLSDYTSFVILPSLLNWLKQTAPKIRIKITPFPPNQRISSLEEGIVDLSVGVSQEFGANIVQQLLFEDQDVCLVRSGHPILQNSITMEEYLSIEFVKLHFSEYSTMDEYLKKQGMKRNTVAEVQDELTIPRIISQTDSIANIAKRVAREVVETMPLKILPLPFYSPPFKIHQFWHTQYQFDPAHQWLRKGMKSICEKL